MEKVSEADLVKRVKAFILNDNYAGALAVVKGVDASRIKNPPILCMIGEVYMHEKQYEVAEEVFLRAYNRSPKNRKVLDLITSLYIEMGEYAEAEYYYKEFISVASRDLHRYILRYRLDKGKGERLSVLIATLEQLKDYEYIEEWAYELATLYEAAGEEKKCIHECDEIVLWFGHGEYVDKAIALKCKLTGEPLPKVTTVEMEMENDRREEEGARRAEAQKEEALERRARYDKRDPKPSATEFIEAGDAHVIDPDDALESAGIDTGIDTDMIQKAMAEKAKAPEDDDSSMTNTGILFGAMESASKGALTEQDLDEDDLEDETETMDEDEKKAVSEDKTETAPKTFQPEKKNTVQEDLSQSQKLMNDVFSTPAMDKVRQQKRGGRPQMPEFLKKDALPRQEDPIDELEAMLAGLPDNEWTEEDLDDEEGEAAETETEEDESDGIGNGLETGKVENTEVNNTETAAVPEIVSEPEPEDADEDGLEVEEALEGMTEDQDEVILEQALFGGLPSGDMTEDDLDAEDEYMDDEKIHISDEDEQFLSELFSSDSSADADKDEVIEEDAAIPQTVKSIFATVPDVKNVHQQLAMTLSQFETSTGDFDVLAPYDINFVVLSGDKGVKSQIAIGIAKALNTYGICDKNKIIRAKASELNRQDFSMIFDKIAGGCLIIERADELSDASVSIIEKEVYKDNQDVAIVLESRQEELKRFWKKHKELRGKFLNVINVSKYNEMELVTLAKSYIEKRGYELSPEGAIVLRDYFKKENSQDDVVSYEDVMTVMDDAIANLEKRNMKNLFMTVLDNKYEEADMLKLLPEDFKGIV